MKRKSKASATIMAFLTVASVFLMAGPAVAQDTTDTAATSTAPESAGSATETMSTGSSAIRFGLLDMGQDNLSPIYIREYLGFSHFRSDVRIRHTSSPGNRHFQKIQPFAEWPVIATAAGDGELYCLPSTKNFPDSILP